MEKIKNTIHRTVLNLLYPIVQLLLRYEIAHGEFTELTRRSSVDVAFKDFVLPNRKNSVSRVSVIAGLSRSEVARLAAAEKDLISKGNTTPNRATRAFGGWLSDSGFIDKNNEPKILPLRHSDISFETLVGRYGGGSLHG